MPQSYSTAESVETIARTLIPDYHPELASARVLCLFQETASRKNGKVVQGVVKKVSGVLQHFCEGDFLLVVALDVWNELDSQRRIALVDHLLERCFGEEDEQTGEMKWIMREPDVHEFSTILKRYGAYTDELAGFLDVARSLDDVAEEVPVSARVQVRARAEAST